MKVVLASWIYIAPPDATSLHPQVGRNIGKSSVQNHYWRSLGCFFASAATHNPESRRMLFTNATELPVVDGVPMSEFFARLNVEVVRLEKLSLPGPGYYGSWGTQFIVLDCLEEFARLCAPEDCILLLDSDCLLNKPVGPELISLMQQSGCLHLTLYARSEVKENGLSTRDLGTLAREFNPPLEREFISYAGGEIIAGTGKALAEVAVLARSTYEQSVERSAHGLSKFNEEAHLLSYVYAVLGYPERTANAYIKRIWTDRGICCNVDGKEGELTMLHLPSEKKWGFKKGFRLYQKNPNLFKDPVLVQRLFNIKPGPGSRLRMAVLGRLRPLVKKLRGKR